VLEGIKINTKRYLEIFTNLAEELMPKRRKPISSEDVFHYLCRKSS